MIFGRPVLLDCMSPSTNEATHPRCSVEGYPDRLGRAAYEEGDRGKGELPKRVDTMPSKGSAEIRYSITSSA